MADKWHAGNAAEDGKRHRGWLLGNFVEADDEIRTTHDLEVKWGIHPASESRATWMKDEPRKTLVILVAGRFRVDLSVGSKVLERQGDYIVWGEGIDHSWEALEDSIVITVRWPSI